MKYVLDFDTNNNTVEITFSVPAGVGSYSDNKTDESYLSEILKEEDLKNPNYKINNLLNITQVVNDTVYDFFGSAEIEIDWRDTYVLEIHVDVEDSIYDKEDIYPEDDTFDNIDSNILLNYDNLNLLIDRLEINIDNILYKEEETCV